MPLPELSPLIAHTLICRTCGNEMTNSVNKDKQGRAHSVYHTCETCNYHISSDEMISGRHMNGPAPVKE